MKRIYILLMAGALAGAMSGAVRGPNLVAGMDQITSQVEGRRRVWLRRPASIQVRREADNALDPAGLRVTQRWKPAPGGLAWEFDILGGGKRTGHELVIDLDVLSPSQRIFIPGEQGVVEVAENPDYQTTHYGAISSRGDRTYVLPLVSILDPVADSALTLALPADANIPHFQVEWSGAARLRLRLGHRAMGGGAATPVRLLLYAHAADYRGALKAYSDDFPAYFHPVMKRGPVEGAFYYHHIHNHPDFAEMARQNVHYLWSSFWFTHLGEYLPAESEWYPYTYAKWWRFGETMSDRRINEFVAEMREHAIGTFAYFNVTEYGGAGNRGGDTAAAARALKERFAGALMHDEKGAPIPTWEGSMAMNPGARYPLWPFLEEQVRRHLARLPGIEGFLIDRLDWASLFDYAHSDGLSMVGDRAVENMAVPVGRAVQGVCRMAHQAGKRVFVNQFHRVEVLRDVDGFCHEIDYARSLGYLAPYRPLAAWHHRAKYDRDLLRFEAQLKTRLQAAMFPHMIAPKFEISQQKPNRAASAMLEIYAPLMEPLMGKRQVLVAHAVEATGANDVNLFINGAGQYVVPLTSRLRFLSQGERGTERVTVKVRVPEARKLAWAHVYSAEQAPCRVRPRFAKGAAVIEVERHGSASTVVVGGGAEPNLPAVAEDIARTRESLFPEVKPRAAAAAVATAGAGSPWVLMVRGRHVAEKGAIAVLLDGRRVGRIPAGSETWKAVLGAGYTPSRAPAVRLLAGDEGTWFRPQRVELAAGPERRVVAVWSSENDAAEGISPREFALPLRPCAVPIQ